MARERLSCPVAYHSLEPMLLPVAVAAVARSAAPGVPIARGVTMPFVNLGGVAEPGFGSNYSAFLALGGRGLDTALTYGAPASLASAEARRVRCLASAAIRSSRSSACNADSSSQERREKACITT